MRQWLLTSVLNPTSAAEDRYKYAHIQSRNKIERAFGVLKPRFRCVDSRGGALLYTFFWGVKLQLQLCVTKHEYDQPHAFIGGL